KPRLQRFRVEPVALLDPLTAREAGNIWMCDSRVFVNLTKEVLAIHQVQRPSKEAVEPQIECTEVTVLILGDVTDHVFLDARTRRTEALSHSVARPWPCDNEVHL